MNKKVLNRFRNELTRQKKNLLEWLGRADQEKKAVVCCSIDGVGSTPENIPKISEINRALDRIDKGDFGKCEKCDEEVELKRLELDFTTCVCLDHYSTDQIDELERDLEMAAKVQQHLFPCCFPALDGLEMAVLAEPAKIVGGDYFDFFRYAEMTQGLAIADVMGKGVSASMLMANLQASIRILGTEHDKLDDLAFHLNKLFQHNLKLIRFITLFLAAVDTSNRKLYYCNAGHNPALWWSSNTQSAQWLKPTGPAIGINPEAQYVSESISIGEGDLIILYTDGLVEAKNDSRQEFGTERLTEFTRRHHEESPELFISNLKKHVLDYAGSIHDDMTMMVLKVT